MSNLCQLIRQLPVKTLHGILDQLTAQSEHCVKTTKKINMFHYHQRQLYKFAPLSIRSWQPAYYIWCFTNQVKQTPDGLTHRSKQLLDRWLKTWNLLVKPGTVRVLRPVLGTKCNGARWLLKDPDRIWVRSESMTWQIGSWNLPAELRLLLKATNTFQSHKLQVLLLCVICII